MNFFMTNFNEKKLEHQFTFILSEINGGHEAYLVHAQFESLPDPLHIWRSIDKPFILEKLRSWCGPYMDFAFNQNSYSLSGIEEFVQKIENQILDSRIDRHVENLDSKKKERSLDPLSYKIVIRDETTSTNFLESFYGDSLI
jgi:hypothetical protein